MGNQGSTERERRGGRNALVGNRKHNEKMKQQRHYHTRMKKKYKKRLRVRELLSGERSNRFRVNTPGPFD